jgi:hypothetical protein
VQGQGHPLRGRLKAGKSRRLSLEEFITRSQEKHGNLYDYSKVEYKHIDHKVCIIDPEYGEFWQTPYQHLNSHGCPARTANKEWIINYDHIIPLSIVHSSKRKNNEWNKDRPLYKFLNSEINLKPVTAKYNKEKTDTVIINDKTVSASSLRNNYVAIGYLIQTILQIDATEILVQDQQFVMNYLGLSKLQGFAHSFQNGFQGFVILLFFAKFGLVCQLDGFLENSRLDFQLFGYGLDGIV